MMTNTQTPTQQNLQETGIHEQNRQECGHSNSMGELVLVDTAPQNRFDTTQEVAVLRAGTCEDSGSDVEGLMVQSTALFHLAGNGDSRAGPGPHCSLFLEVPLAARPQ